MATHNLGRIMPIFKGQYNSSEQYTRWDVVLYNGSSYIYNKAENYYNRIPGDDDTWLLMAKGISYGDLTEAEKTDIVNNLLSRVQIPEPQTTEFSTDTRHYIWSGADGQGGHDNKKVMVVKNTEIIQDSGELKFRRGMWSPNANGTSNTVYAMRVPVATTTADGAMSKEDKVKLNKAESDIEYLEAEVNSNIGRLNDMFDRLIKFEIYNKEAYPGTLNYTFYKDDSGYIDKSINLNNLKFQITDSNGTDTGQRTLLYMLKTAYNVELEVTDLRADFDNLENNVNQKNEIFTAAIGTIPTRQTANRGTTTNYIYSDNTNSNLCVLANNNTGFVWQNNRLAFRKGHYNPANTANQYSTVYIDSFVAEADKAGFMSAEDKTALDNLKTNFTTTWKTEVDSVIDEYAENIESLFDNVQSLYGGKLDVSQVYKYTPCYIHNNDTADNRCRAVNMGGKLWTLTTNSTESEIKNALENYVNKVVLKQEDLDYCAENGICLFDQATQGFVSVTSNGGGFFNFIETSMTNYTELPKMRFVSIRVKDNYNITYNYDNAGNQISVASKEYLNTTYKVYRNGQEDTLVFKSEYNALAEAVQMLGEEVIRIGSLVE